MVSWTPHIFSKQLSNDATRRPRYSDARCRPAQWRGRIAQVSSKEAERTAQKKHTRGTAHREPKLVMLAISAHRNREQKTPSPLRIKLLLIGRNVSPVIGKAPQNHEDLPTIRVDLFLRLPFCEETVTAWAILVRAV
jgi:hypothetical protein